MPLLGTLTNSSLPTALSSPRQLRSNRTPLPGTQAHKPAYSSYPPHVVFEVDDIEAALRNQKILIEPNSPSPGVTVAFIEVQCAPVELMQIDRDLRKDLWARVSDICSRARDRPPTRVSNSDPNRSPRDCSPSLWLTRRSGSPSPGIPPRCSTRGI